MFQATKAFYDSSADAVLQREGLPYWTLYLLLSVILLLLAFIFLRDKDRRQRLSLSLHGPRRRWDRITLQARQAREKKKKASLLRELGWTARRDKIKPKEAGDVWRKLNDLESKLQPARAEMTRLSARMVSLRLKGSRRRKDAAGEQTVKIAKKGLRKTLAGIASLERLQNHLLEDLGKTVRASRSGHEAFLPLYAQLDLADESIAEFQAAIDKLKKA